MSSGGIKVGDLVMGKFRVERVLGEGAMGCVLAVTNVDMELPFAIKLMKPSKARAESHARFVREARITGRLKCEHAVKVHDVGTTPEGEAYMLMEHLDGYDLARHLQARGPLPVDEAVEWILQACEALAEAHALGVVHRDIKPANLFLARIAGRVILKVLDFGVSKLSDDSSLTGGGVVGSPLYMSPEQMRASKDVDARCDVWALGVTLYELLAGRSPFLADKIEIVCSLVLTQPPPSLLDFRPDVPAALERVILSCLEKDRDRRMTSVAALAAALMPFAQDDAKLHAKRAAEALGVEVALSRPTVELQAASTPAQTAPLPEGTTGGGAALAQKTMQAPQAAPKRRRGAIAAAIAVLMTGGAATAAIVASRGSRGEGPASAGSGTVAVSVTAPPPEPPKQAEADASPVVTLDASVDAGSFDQPPQDRGAPDASSHAALPPPAKSATVARPSAPGHKATPKAPEHAPPSKAPDPYAR